MIEITMNARGRNLGFVNLAIGADLWNVLKSKFTDDLRKGSLYSRRINCNSVEV